MRVLAVKTVECSEEDHGEVGPVTVLIAAELLVGTCFVSSESEGCERRLPPGFTFVFVTETGLNTGFNTVFRT